MQNEIVFGDNLAFLATVADSSINLIYIDPPFNTGKRQTRNSIVVVRDEKGGDRIGFQGASYRTTVVGQSSYDDVFDDYIGFIVPRFKEAYRVLAPDGSFFLHMDQREVHYCKLWLDDIFGRDCFMNEIIWAYDYGARSRCRWSRKHDTILWYAKDPERYTFNIDEMDRIQYMAPSLVTPEKAARGKTPTDTWWHTIVSPTGKEKTGYPTQKPIGIVDRIVRVHSRPGDTLLDFFAGSGTLGHCAVNRGRRFILVDNNPEAIAVMKKRLAFSKPKIRNIPARDTADQRRSGPISQGGGTIAEANANLGKVTILAVAVSDYKHIPTLPGPAKDLEKVKAMFLKNVSTSAYRKEQFIGLLNPTHDDLRRAVVDYAASRSARGDILIFYFSGHGCVPVGNEFCFCATDTKRSMDGNSVLPLTVLSFRDAVQTLASQDVHPVFLIDACFSGSAVNQAISGVMENQLQQLSGAAYGILCSSYQTNTSIDTSHGGAFTQALCAIAQEGRNDRDGKRLPFLTLRDLGPRLQARLTRNGFPLSRCHIGADLPEVPLVRNTTFRPQREKFTPYLRRIIEYLWNNAAPREVSLSEIADKIGRGAYGNHSKLSLAPWSLVEDGSGSKYRRLTSKGRAFAARKKKIPRVLVKDPVSGEWKPEHDCPKIRIDEV